MTKADIVNDIAKKTGVDKAAVQLVVESFMESVKNDTDYGGKFFYKWVL